MHNQIVVSLEDLRYVCIRCPHCNSRTILDLTAKFDYSPERPKFATEQCSTCYQRIDSAVAELNNFQRAYLALRDAGISKFLSFYGESAFCEDLPIKKA